MATDPIENPAAGWAIGGSPDLRSSPAKKWLSLKNLLIGLLVAWNGYFLAALIYEATVQSSSRSTVSAIIVWIWIVGDAVFLVCSWVVRSILGRRCIGA